MSHSTHIGFSGPPTTALSGGVLRSICDGGPLFDASCAVGVGHCARLAIDVSDGRTAAPGDGDWFVPYSDALGVGNIATHVASPSPLRSERPALL